MPGKNLTARCDTMEWYEKERYHSKLYEDSERRAADYRKEENARRIAAGGGLLLAKRYTSVLKGRAKTLRDIRDDLLAMGDHHQRQSMKTALEILADCEHYVQRHCRRRVVTLTKDYIFNLPVSEISKESGKGYKETHLYLVLLSCLGLIKRVPHDSRRSGESYIGNMGIRAQDYQFTAINKRQVLSRWGHWCREGGAVSKISEKYVASIFGRRATSKIYFTPESVKTGMALREEQKARREQPDYWANNNSGTNLYQESRKARLEIRAAISMIRNRTSCLKEIPGMSADVPSINGKYWVFLPCDKRKAKVWLDGGRYRWISNDDVLNVSKMLGLWLKFRDHDKSVFQRICRQETWWHDDSVPSTAKIWDLMVAWFPGVFWDENGERRQFGTILERKENCPPYYVLDRADRVEKLLFLPRQKVEDLLRYRLRELRTSLLNRDRVSLSQGRLKEEGLSHEIAELAELLKKQSESLPSSRDIEKSVCRYRRAIALF